MIRITQPQTPKALVDAWIDFSTRELDAPLLSLYLPLLNVWHYDKQVLLVGWVGRRERFVFLGSHLQLCRAGAQQQRKGRRQGAVETPACSPWFPAAARPGREGSRAPAPILVVLE